ncbi:MAG: Gx transporter family protein [Eubacteriales bacterium]
MTHRRSPRYISTMAMLITIALILSYVETLIPALPIPGAKIGLPNVVTLLALLVLGFTDALIIQVIRAFVSALLFSSAMALAYSLAGGMLSLLVMFLLTRTYKDELGLSILFVSVMGAIAHSTGQVLVAMAILETPAILSYLPWLVIISVVTGLIVGFAVYLVHKPFKQIVKNHSRP